MCVFCWVLEDVCCYLLEGVDYVIFYYNSFTCNIYELLFHKISINRAFLK